MLSIIEQVDRFVDQECTVYGFECLTTFSTIDFFNRVESLCYASLAFNCP